jgi:hypothetical protein
MIKVEDYISDVYIHYIIDQYEYQLINGERCYFDKGDDIYQYGLFYDGKKYYTVNILGGPEYLKKKVREIRLNKILK